MSKDIQPVAKSNKLRRFGIYLALLLVAFLIGFVPMWIKGRQCVNDLAESRHQLSLAQIENNLSSAAIYSRKGDYEAARQAVSKFFTSLREETDKSEGSVFTSTQQDGLKPLFATRDDLVTLLARSDPASADRLSELFISYKKLVS